MRVIVTGGTGFLGGWLISDFLDKSFDVVVVRNPQNQVSYRQDSQYFIKNLGKNCTEVFLDILDFESVVSLVKKYTPDLIVHMAAIGDITIAQNEPKLTYEVSSNGTLNFLEAVRLYSPDTQFLSHTTDKVYSGNLTPFREDMLFNPTHIYEAAKVSQEYLTRIYAQSYGVRAVTIRCGNYFGGFDFNFNRIVPYVIKCVVEGKSIELRSDGSFTRDFLYIKDAVNVNNMLIEALSDDSSSVLVGSAYNFSLEIKLSVLQIVHSILELCDSDLPVEIKGNAASEIPNMQLDCLKARNELNWTPEYSLKQGLEESIDFYRSYFQDRMSN